MTTLSFPRFSNKKKIFFSPPKREVSRAQQQTTRCGIKTICFPSPQSVHFKLGKGKNQSLLPLLFSSPRVPLPPPGENTVSAISHKSSAIKKGEKESVTTIGRRKGVVSSALFICSRVISPLINARTCGEEAFFPFFPFK